MTENQEKEILALLLRIADATERTARHTFWIALPIWIGIVLTVWGFLTWLSNR